MGPPDARAHELDAHLVQFVDNLVNPGAQELETEYEFHYGFAVHSTSVPLYVSANIADAASEKTLAMYLNQADIPSKLLTPIVQCDNPNIRVSSMRVREDAVLVTMYNLENETVDALITVEEDCTGVALQEFAADFGKTD